MFDADCKIFRLIVIDYIYDFVIIIEIDSDIFDADCWSEEGKTRFRLVGFYRVLKARTYQSIVLGAG